MKRNIRFAGSGGQGVILTSVLLAKAYGLGKGFNISQTQSYGPEARGGACKAELVVSDKDIDYMKVEQADIFVAFNQAGYDNYIDKTKSDALILVNETLITIVEEEKKYSTTARKIFRIAATEIADEIGNPTAMNIVMLGALTFLLDNLERSDVLREIEKSFDEKNITTNIAAFEQGYQYLEGLRTAAFVPEKGRNKVMVCVTTQKSCERLIKYGRELIGDTSGEISIIHIANKQFKMLDETTEETLDYLYESALKYGTNLMVIRSDNTVQAMANLVASNGISIIVLGETKKEQQEPHLISDLREAIGSRAQLIILPSN